jgi:thioesterase domain-containing protein
VSVPDTITPGAAFGADYLRRRLADEFPLARHIGVEVESADESGVVLCAPFAPNANFKGTAFGGSLFCVAVLAGWAWSTRYLALRGIDAEAVIQESSIRYLAPVRATLRATLLAPSTDRLDKFRRMLSRAGRGRIALRVDIREGETLATQFDGVFVATTR